ncbi:MAG TPA: type I-U CRISPR-associated RAMP protein Csb1/Cas7u [Candidatus Sulfotelmatobacter sp.]|nr:type I-U CRISPR-associated RAMP protein Csb1/Cas7u [Candidatus Sulfotelmatobacter sp.]
MSKFIDNVKAAKAVRVTETLVSMSSSIKLPSYAADKRADLPRFVEWGNNAVVDSVQSQANRIEAVFTQYPELVPATQVKYPDTTVPLVEVPHRAADPAISYLFRDELAALKSNPALLAKRAPTSFLFGLCDIRGGRNIKLTRAIASDVVVRNGAPRPTASSLSTRFSNETRADFAEKLAEHGLTGAEIGVEQIPAYSERGTVDVSHATIERTVVLSLEVFDEYKSSPDLHDYLVSLALVALLAPTSSVLRSGTTLVRQSRKVEVFADLKPAEVVDETGLFEQVLEYARRAAKKFGIGQPETLTVDIDRIIAEAKSGSETKKGVKAKKAIKKAAV